MMDYGLSIYVGIISAGLYRQADVKYWLGANMNLAKYTLKANVLENLNI